MLGFFLFVACFVGAFGIAPLTHAKHPVDRHGLRHYSVVFAENAPRLTLDSLRNWAQNFSAVDPSKIGDSWSIGNFSGFPAWLSNEGLQQLRQHHLIAQVAEARKITIHPMELDTTKVHSLSVGPAGTAGTGNDFTTRPDWGQMRIQQKALNLATTPAGLYAAANLDPAAYPDAGAPVGTGAGGSWNWTVPFAMLNTGSGAHIWIADSGVNYMHQEFIDPATGRSRVIYRLDCTADANAPTGQCVPSNNPDVLGHGTHVSASAAGRWRGVAPGATLGMLRVFDNQTNGDGNWVLSAVSYAVKNQVPGKYNILSMSLGGDPDPVLDAALLQAWSEGLIVVVAAGNDGNDSCTHSPADDSQPFGLNSIITVGASDATDTRADFSNFGVCTTIFAPGVQIHSAWINSTTNYNTIDGTSMATPLVAGSIAVLVTGFPGWRLTPTTARSWLYGASTPNVISDTEASSNRLVYAGK